MNQAFQMINFSSCSKRKNNYNQKKLLTELLELKNKFDNRSKSENIFTKKYYS